MSGTRREIAGWLMIGFALGGFFDGILLHQILQWHHLLSGLVGPESRSLPFQILMDGAFHLLMYVLALLGAILVLQRRSDDARLTTSPLAQLTLVGFASWHVLDAVLSHWLLGIHRIRMDSSQPLFWDLAWLIAFGLGPLGVVWAMRCAGRGGGSGWGVTTGLLLFTIGAGIISAVGSSLTGPQETIVVFRDRQSQQKMMNSVMASGASVRWTDATGRVWGITPTSLGGTLHLYANGAALVSSTPILAGCLAWTRV